METIIANIPKCFLFVGSVLFFYYGTLGVLNPVNTVVPMELNVGTNIAKTEIRATYGGLLLGIGLFLLYSAFFEVKIGLVAVLLIVGGIGITRLFSIFYDNSSSSIHWYLLAMELASVIIALVLLLIYFGVSGEKNT